MDYDGAGIQTRRARATAAAVTEASSSLLAPPLDEETLWQMNMRGGESIESGSYPQRPGEPDCAYYLRTGLCRYGLTCRYNHPPNRKLAIAAARLKGGYPERVGQPECQYYLKTGTCKFGATCKFHHPKDKAGILGRAELNILGYPIRPNEEECAYYLRTGQCKFGNTCKFHHPQPSNVMVSLSGSPFNPPVHSPTSPSQSYAGGLTSWPSSRASFIPSPQWQGPSSYAQVILPQGLVQVPSWNAYPGQLRSVSSSESQQQAPGPVQIYGSSRPSETSAGAQGIVSSYQSSSIPMGQYALQMDNVFPERPDQPECQFYMKTGDCKFGASCKFHHPKERLIPAPNCLLSPSGLPLRPVSSTVRENLYAFFILVMGSANLVQIANLTILR
uniref:Zinc finger CCCH domain-containing protein ZFN-like isoform X2 n=1 Tax=Elaeis guineensis var. tenera TaxID=51953 RepID=A0A8N4ETQ9_ELAGV|nr:zinc finger CCCH domain-containing protein ZFN-like isoform X2 [Elaeis guineensis]